MWAAIENNLYQISKFFKHSTVLLYFSFVGCSVEFVIVAWSDSDYNVPFCNTLCAIFSSKSSRDFSLGKGFCKLQYEPFPAHVQQSFQLHEDFVENKLWAILSSSNMTCAALNLVATKWNVRHIFQYVDKKRTMNFFDYLVMQLPESWG